MTTATQVGFNRITVELQPPAARIVLNNPPLNVIDVPMMDELRAALEQIETRAEISSIVLAGSERAFSVGVDIAAHTPDKVRDMLTAFHSVIRSVWGFPEIKLACYPPVAAVALSAIVGQKLAAELVLTGRTLNGQEALQAGLVNGLAENPETLVTECVQRVSQLSSAAIALAKKAFYAWDAIHFDKGLARAEQIYFDELMKTADAQEGITAFIERRRPKWVGK